MLYMCYIKIINIQFNIFNLSKLNIFSNTLYLTIDIFNN